ncbi:methyl-accepting chemotaxis protein [Paenibacillus sp. P96]|uniref:Methyl-accepting chemotaxis protein n=1 Tax=Paenibacillus zeirhizosphaerae TaxID=2987519 RepID=A0ABT9FL48_9BACL|nr:methyl-accepting chemotaxis protein [Paenibacillus sp. P96]MDP4095315.1 methyl-accepting chemotaxis protein [Paenibacillus sp. P96]
MLRFNRSIAAKLKLLNIAILLAASLLFSISFYAVSMSIINSYVVPLSVQSLETGAQELYSKLNATQALQTRQSGAGAVMTVESYLQEKVSGLKLESAYLATVTDQEVAIVARSTASAYQIGDKLPFMKEMQQAIDSHERQTTGVYKDQYGVHKTAFYSIPGSNLIVAVNTDVGFIEQKTSQIFWICLVITVAVIAAGWFVSTLTLRKITRPIAELVKHSEQIAAGDLSRELHIRGKDEIAQLAGSFQKMTGNLKEMIGQVSITSNAVVEGSDDLLRRVDAVSGTARQTAHSAEEVAKGSMTIATAASENARAMEEITQGIQHIAASSGEVSEQISKAADEAVNGNTLAQNAVSQMNLVGEAAEESLKYVKTMNKRSEAIGEVVSSIFEITKQIQMLSLNASIEAARAGEHGRGFAVVAGEVRKLAEQSKTATQQISDYLLTLKEDSHMSVNSMSRVNTEIVAGSELVQRAGAAFNELMDVIQNVNMTIQAVSAATEEVSAGSEEVSASVEETANITARAQEMVQEIGHSAEQQLAEMDDHARTVRKLNKEASALQQAVLKFKL